MQRILVLGAGFAGLWAALAAARARDLARSVADPIEIVVIDSCTYHSIRVRNYEADLSPTLVELKTILDPVGILHRQAEVTQIDVAARIVTCRSRDEVLSISYDRLICALGSRLVRPPIPGLAQHGFDVDTYVGANKLACHLAALPRRTNHDGQFTVLIVGAGLTGIEAAAEMPARLRAIIAAHPGAGKEPHPRVILADRGPLVGADMGGARPVITAALQALEVETRTSVSLASVDENGATLTSGERIPAATVIWCAGMQANPLAAQIPVPRDRLGRLPVDQFLKVQLLADVFAAGDIADLAVDDTHRSVMSCQHGRPMGRFAGHNAVCDLLGQPMLALQIPWYTTILDLGAEGAVYTEGWDRHLVASGAEAKQTKELINRQRIYPPLTGDGQAILDAAAPVVQAPPPRFT